MGAVVGDSPTTAFLAWFGALLSSALALLRVLEFRRDSARVVVSYATGYEVLNSPDHDPDKTYAVVKVVNRGRRPVTITSIAALPKSRKDKVLMLMDALRGSRELLEGKSTEYLFEQDLMDFGRIKCFVAYDMTGKQYRCKVRAKRTFSKERAE